MTVNIQDTDMFFVQRTSTRDSVNLKLYGDQLRNYIESTQLNLNNEVVGDVENLKIEVDQIKTDISLILGQDRFGNTDGLLFEIKEDFANEILRLDDVDTDIKIDIGDLDIRIKRLEEYSDIKGFYYIQPSSEFAISKETGMVFDNPKEDEVTKIRINKEDLRGTTFSFLNVNEGEKIEIIRFDTNNVVRRRLLYNIKKVTPPSDGIEYVEVEVTYLFSTGEQPLSEIISDKDEVRVELFPAFDASGTVDQSYVDNAIEKLEIDLSNEIDQVKLLSGVTSVEAIDDSITVNSSAGGGTGIVRISANPKIVPYNLLTAKSDQLGGVKVTTLSGAVHALVGINNLEKLVVQESTNDKRGVNFKGQCCIVSGSVPNTSEFGQGQIIWHTDKKVLYIVT